MPRFGPIKRRDLIQHLRGFGFTGHLLEESMNSCKKETLALTIPNPHGRDIGLKPWVKF